MPPYSTVQQSTQHPGESHQDLTVTSMTSTPSYPCSCASSTTSSSSSSTSNSPTLKSPQTSVNTSAAIPPVAPKPPQPLHAPQLVWLTWQNWESVAITLRNIPKAVTTYLLWQTFGKQGNITAIDIFDDRHGYRTSRGRIRFRYVSIAFP